jgi:DNA recombination protein RmuC
LDWILIASSMAVGFSLGLAASFALRLIQSRTGREIAEEILRDSEDRRRMQVDTLLRQVESSFGNLSLEALSRSTEEFLKLAHERFEGQRTATQKDLESKKGLIDQQLQLMKAELEGVSNLVKTLEKDREAKFGSLTKQMVLAGEQTGELIRTTAQLREALASSRARGQWGERMAEDVLRAAGFQESVNYEKQMTIASAGRRPDFTFLLPKGLKLHMDVKFPLDNYLRFLDAGSDIERKSSRDQFLRDVRKQIKEVSSREYINPEDHTVDCALLFIPNEAVYSFIHEQDRTILDEALAHRVIFCSPLTLFAILAVVREAVDHFALEKTSNEILSLLGAFKKQWGEFVKKLETVGKRIEDARKEYEALTTTRRRQLERPLEQLDSLRTEMGIPVAEIEVEAAGELEE